MNWAGRNVLITGGAGGIGLAVASAYCRNGASVVLTDFNKNKLIEAKNKLQGPVLPLALDVTNESETLAVLDCAIEEYGKIDIVVPNAGILHLDKFLKHHCWHPDQGFWWSSRRSRSTHVLKTKGLHCENRYDVCCLGCMSQRPRTNVMRRPWPWWTCIQCQLFVTMTRRSARADVSRVSIALLCTIIL